MIRETCLLSLILLSACRGGSAVVDDTAGPLDDTGDTAADDTGGSGGDDTGEDPGEPTLVFAVDTELSDAAVELHRLDLATYASAGRVGAARVHEGEAAFIVAEPDDSELVSMADDGYPDTFIALYRGALWDDTDGSLEADGDEVYSGLGLHQPLYVKGPLPDGWEELGIAEGWNVLRNRLTEAEPYVVDPLQIPLDDNALPVESLDLGGPLSLGEEDAGVAVLSAAVLYEIAYVEPLHDGPVEGETWAVALDGAPSAEHLYDWDEGGLEYAYELPVLYADNDHDDVVSEPDEAIGFACTPDGVAAAALWIPPAEDFETLLGIVSAGFSFGWNAVSIGETWEILSSSEREELSLGEGCLVEE